MTVPPWVLFIPHPFILMSGDVIQSYIVPQGESGITPGGIDTHGVKLIHVSGINSQQGRIRPVRDLPSGRRRK